MHIVITGGCGFIGSNFVRLVRQQRPQWRVTNVDDLTYAGNLANVREFAHDPGYTFAKVDIANQQAVDDLFQGFDEPADYVVNFAAESHVDRSIMGPGAFVRTNVNGAFHLVDALRRSGRGRFLQVSTDEVYGSLRSTDPAFTEDNPIVPSSPYSASKAAADHIVNAYHHTFGVDAVITRCSNNYGPYQFPEKLIPLMILNASKGKSLPVYGDGGNIRDWIHVSDHCRGILAVLEHGESGRVYNLGGNTERTNLQIVEFIAKTVAGDTGLITFVKDRPGHDWRYAMDTARARRELDWTPQVTFEEGLAETIRWYLDHEPWWQPILSGQYRDFYAAWYGGR